MTNDQFNHLLKEILDVKVRLEALAVSLRDNTENDEADETPPIHGAEPIDIPDDLKKFFPDL